MILKDMGAATWRDTVTVRVRHIEEGRRTTRIPSQLTHVSQLEDDLVPPLLGLVEVPGDMLEAGSVGLHGVHVRRAPAMLHGLSSLLIF